MPDPCLKIGLTGGIGCGKTTVSNLFAELGVPVIDADVIARELLAPGSASSKQVIALFGNDITSAPDTIDRKKLGRLVFDNREARNTLEQLLHPQVHDEIDKRAQSITAPYCIIVIPLLLEAGHQDLVDRILVVNASTENQVERTSNRDQTSPDYVRKVIDSQISAAERLELADDVIQNDGNLEQLAGKVKTLDKRYRSLAQLNSY